MVTILSNAYRRTGDLSIAEDLAQDTFLTAWNSRKNFKNKPSFKAWLTSILKFKVDDYYRRRRIEVSPPDLLDLSPPREGSSDDWMNERFL